MTCVTAFGFSPGNVWRYQKSSDPSQQRAVLDKYLASLGTELLEDYRFQADIDHFAIFGLCEECLQSARDS